MPRRPIRIAAALFLTLGAGAATAGDAARGAYLANIMHCNGCHTPRGPDGALEMDRFLSGGTVGFEIPGLGIFWPPNLTPDPTGLGGWTDAQIVDAIRKGVRPDGRVLAPAMPANDYAALGDADAADLIAFLRSLPPTPNLVPAPAGAEAEARGPFYRVVPPN